MTDDEHELEYHDLEADEIATNAYNTHTESLPPYLDQFAKENPLQESIYLIAHALCDPLQQPPDNEQQILSLDFLADILIPLSYSKVSQESAFNLESENTVHFVKFTLSTYYFRLYCALQETLNAHDELKLRHVDNSSDLWIGNLHHWVPSKEVQMRPHEFKVYYSMSCLLLVAVYKLFAPLSQSDSYNLSRNPYLFHLVKSWKCHTNIVLLALEIDRRIEYQNEQEDSDEQQTPEIVYNVLEGSSAIRTVLAWILNQNPSVDCPDNNLSFELVDDDIVLDLTIDIKEISLLEFVLPLSRNKVNGGALRVDMRLIVIALLIIKHGSKVYSQTNPSREPNEEYESRKKAQMEVITAIPDLLVDLEYDDRFDEDIRYIFEYELEDSQNGDVETVEDVNPPIEEVPLGDDLNYTPKVRELITNFQTATGEDKKKYIFEDVTDLGFVLKCMVLGVQKSDSSERNELQSQILLNSIAYARQADEESNHFLYPGMVFGFLKLPAPIEDIKECLKKNLFLLPIFPITNFELFLKNNTQLARNVLDELMLHTYTRRKTLKFLASELNLNPLIIDYLFELLSGLRGKVILSDKEAKLFLHTFLSHCGDFFAAVDGIEDADGNRVILPESVAKKNMLLLCLMINRLIVQGIIKLGSEESRTYNTELRELLIGWIGKVKEARTLYFEISSALYDDAKEVVRERSNKEDPASDEKSKPEETQVREYGISEATMDQIDKCETSAEFTSLLQESLDIKAEFDEYIERFKFYILSMISVSNSLVIHIPPAIAVGDLQFFLDNFNSLSKVEYFASVLFEVFEMALEPETKLAENEFSEAFINGEAGFKEEKKKKKKKKNKKKK